MGHCTYKLIHKQQQLGRVTLKPIRSHKLGKWAIKTGVRLIECESIERLSARAVNHIQFRLDFQ